MTFSFIKMPGATSVNNEPQMLNEDVHHIIARHYQVKGGDGGTNIHKKYNLKMTQHPDKSMRGGPYGDTVVMHGKKDDLHKFNKDWLGGEEEVKKGKAAHPAAKTVDGAPKMKNEALKGDQHKLDHDKDGDIDAKDFAMLRKKKKAGKHEDEPEGENGETAGKAGELGKDKMKKDTKEYKMVSKPSMKSMPKKLTMSKESTTTSGYSRIREALLSVVEKKEISHGHLDNKDNYDDKFKGKGAKDMKKDHMKGDVDDTLALARKDVSAAGRRVATQAKGRNAGDKVSSGDRNVVPAGTKMTDPASPKSKMESIVNAYKSIHTKN